MQNINDNIDLDALFDMLNIADRPDSTASATAEKKFVSQLDPNPHIVPDLSPLEDDYPIVDLPIDQS